MLKVIYVCVCIYMYMRTTQAHDLADMYDRQMRATNSQSYLCVCVCVCIYIYIYIYIYNTGS